MFNFLKKSRAVKFLCSACLICSLGSFVSVYGADESTGDQIAELYVKGELGYETERIFLANPSLSAAGVLTGTLKYAKNLDDFSAPDESTAVSLWNDLEDSELTLFLKNKSGEYIAASGTVTFDKDSSSDDNYDISVQLYKIEPTTNPEKITDTESATKLELKIPGRYAVTGIVSKEGTHTLIEGPVLSNP